MGLFQQAMSLFLQVSLTLTSNSAFLLTYSPFFMPLTTTPMFLTPPVSQPTSGWFSLSPILTLDMLAHTKGLLPKKAPGFSEQACLRHTAQPGWGSQAQNYGDMEFDDVSFSLASGSKTKTICSCPSRDARHTLFCPLARHARVLRRVCKAQSCSGPDMKN